jgi:hypothetical protein
MPGNETTVNFRGKVKCSPYILRGYAANASHAHPLAEHSAETLDVHSVLTMIEKYLTDSEWKKSSKGQAWKDAALLKVLAGLDKADKTGPEVLKSALDDVEKQIDLLLKAHKGDKGLTAALTEVDKALARQRKAVEQAMKAAPASDGDEDDSTALLTSKLVTLLRQVRQGVVMHALVALGAKRAVVMLSVRDIPAPRRKLLTAELGTTSGVKFIVGQCLFEANAPTFVVDAAAGGLAKKLGAALLTQTGQRVKVRVRGSDPNDVDEDLDDAIQAPPSHEQLAFEARQAVLAARLQQALQAQAGEVGKLRALDVFVQEKAASGQYKAALQALESMEKLLSAVTSASPGAPASSAAPATSTMAPAPDAAASFKTRLTALMPLAKAAMVAGHTAQADIKAKIGEAGALAQQKDFAAANALLDGVDALLASGKDDGDWQKAKATWQRALEIVDTQLDAVRAGMVATGDPDFLRIADLGLPALTRHHKTPVMASLMDVDRSSGDARGAACQRARQAVAAFQAHVQVEPKLKALDEASGTAFGVPLNLRRALGAGLEALSQALRRMDKAFQDSAR